MGDRFLYTQLPCAPTVPGAGDRDKDLPAPDTSLTVVTNSISLCVDSRIGTEPYV